MGEICHDCGGEYERLTMHWNRSPCDRLPFSENQLEMISGLLMGDGDLHHRDDPNPLFRVRMTNQQFLCHLNSEFGVLSRGVTLNRSAAEMYEQAVRNQQEGLDGFETVNKSNYNALYGLRTVSHPDLHRFKEWYGTDGKRFPECLELTPTILRMWYVCDGWLARDSESTDSPRIMLKASNERYRQDFLIGLFEDIGFSAGFSRDSVQISAYDTDAVLEWMGPSPPGFLYKWET